MKTGVLSILFTVASLMPRWKPDVSQEVLTMYCSSTRKREWMIEKDGHCGLGEMVHEGLEVLKKGRYVDRFV